VSVCALIELIVAGVPVIGAVVLYRRRGREAAARTGSQAAVIC
jgi:hypothetical protein